ncbi:MAG: transglycosylase SLT domain-containing protein [Chloroflexota bacterium]
MNENYEFQEDYETASMGGGYLPGLWMPPLVVILIGLLIGLLTSGVFVTQSATAASNPEEASFSDPFFDSTININSNDSHEKLAGVFTPEVLYWKQDILEWSGNTGLDPNLIATVMQIESCGDPHAISSAGAMGLFQVMPFHFSSSDDPYEPDTNALRGLAYLSLSFEASNGNTRLALAGYNGGISVIHKSENSWAEETQRYAYWGSGIYEEASLGIANNIRLQEWLSYGGESLCMQAATRLGLNP